MLMHGLFSLELPPRSAMAVNLGDKKQSIIIISMEFMSLFV